MQTRPPKCSFSQPTREKPYLQYLVTQQSNIIPHLVDSPNFQTYKYTKGDISTFYHSDQSINTTFYIRGHFYILPFYKLQSDQSTDLLPPQKTFLLSNHPNHYKSTILPNQSGDSNIPTIQTTDPKIISRQSYHTKVKIPTFLPFQPLQTYHSTKVDISTFLLSKSTDSKVIS